MVWILVIVLNAPYGTKAVTIEKFKTFEGCERVKSEVMLNGANGKFSCISIKEKM